MTTKVKWLCKFPDHWDLLPSKRLFPESKERAFHSDEQLSATQSYGVISQAEFTRLAGRRVVQLNQNLDLRKRVEIGDFVISMRSFQGGLERAWAAGGIRSSYVVLRPRKDLDLGYYQRLFKSTDYIQALQSTATFIRDGQDMNYQNFALIDLPLPPVLEQYAIAAFLDHETARIDALIEEQRHLIGLLKEKRQAVISHAVTKGLDPSVPMKDSGVEWLGNVPAHWRVAPLKFWAELNPKKSEYSGDQSQSCSFVPMEKLKTGVLVLDEERIVSDVITGYTFFQDGDILQAKVTPCFENKNIAIARGLVNGVGFGSSEINVIRVMGQVDQKFLYYRLQEDSYIDLCTSAMFGAGGLKRVPTEMINNFSTAMPGRKEQEDIAKFLDIKTQRFEVLIMEADRGVELLKEHRSALISAAVTGKIDLRGWQPSARAASPELEQETV